MDIRSTYVYPVCEWNLLTIYEQNSLLVFFAAYNNAQRSMLVANDQQIFIKTLYANIEPVVYIYLGRNTYIFSITSKYFVKIGK